MKKFISRNILTLIIVSIVLTIMLLPSLSQENSPLVLSFVVVFFYAILFILLYGVSSSLIAELLSLRASSKNRKIIKAVTFLVSLAVFSYFSPNLVYVLYAFIVAALYFLIDEFLRKKDPA
ncbi:hypothetical protein [Cytobacillus firmus]|uniref:Uncharacterized protein n=1 Tax=Cytobacillus firmus DS1 TaxID=1307436 RepID=W7L0V7_CYTFI|nr:hypothetical protein [Cytobacillus firmus]EWG08707.1 hypothetical protein PBF_22754 [Cytobacillus firmus DS1]